MINIKPYISGKILVVLVSFLAIFFIGTIKTMKMSPAALKMAKNRKAQAQAKKLEEEKIRLREEQKAKLMAEKEKLTTEEEKEMALKPDEYYFYVASDPTKAGIIISLEALKQSDLLTSMVDMTDIRGGKKIPLANYSSEQIKIVGDSLKDWLENKKKVEKDIKALSLDNLIVRANLFNVFGVPFDIMRVLFNAIDLEMGDQHARVNDLKGLNLDVKTLLMRELAINHLKAYIVTKKNDKKPDAIIGKEVTNITAVAFSPDGKILIAGDSYMTMNPAGSFGKLILWDMNNLENPKIIENIYNINTLKFSKDGKKIAAGCIDDIIIFNISDLKNITFKSAGNIGGDIKAIDFSPDGNKVVTGSSARCVLWDISNLNSNEYKSKYTFIGGNDASNIDGVAFSPDGSKIAMGSGNKLTLWDISNLNNIIFRSIGIVEKSIKAIGFSPDGNKIITGGPGNIVLWNLKNNTSTVLQEKITNVGALTFNLDGNKVLSIYNQDNEENIYKYFTSWDISAPSIKIERDVQSVIFVREVNSPAACSVDGGKIVIKHRYKTASNRYEGRSLHLFTFATNEQMSLIDDIGKYTDFDQIQLIYELSLWPLRYKEISGDQCSKHKKVFEKLPLKMQQFLIDIQYFCKPKKGFFGLW